MGFSLISRLRGIAERVRSWIFARRYGIDAYSLVQGRELRTFLDREYGQKGWSWDLKVLGIDRENFEFEVRYDDRGPWAGVVAVAPHRPPEERFRIVRKEDREWPPPEWNDDDEDS